LDQTRGPIFNAMSAEDVAKIHCIRSFEQNVGLDESVNENHYSFYMENITWEYFLQFLRFLYIGELKDASTKVCPTLISLADQFQLPSLTIYCENIQSGLAELNPSISTWLVDRSADMALRIFFGKSVCSDVSVDIGDRKLFLHKVLCSHRCEVLQTMIQYAEKENRGLDLECDIDTFLVILEFLYTSHLASAFDQDDPKKLFNLLLESDKFRVPRLMSFCEYFFTKVVEKAVEESLQKADFDVIGLLETADRCKAEQLSKWCLHFISSNYGPMSKRPEFERLTGKNLEYVENNQWPPKSYHEKVKKYESDLEAWEKKTGKSDNCIIS